MPKYWKRLISLTGALLGIYLLLFLGTRWMQKKPTPAPMKKESSPLGALRKIYGNEKMDKLVGMVQSLPPAMVKALLLELQQAMQNYYLFNEEYPPHLTPNTLKEIEDYTNTKSLLKLLHGQKIDSYKRGEHNFEIQVTLRSKDHTRYRITSYGVFPVR